MLFVLVDAHWKWPEVYPMKNTTSGDTIEVLRKIFSSHGLPEEFVTVQFRRICYVYEGQWYSTHKEFTISPCHKRIGRTVRAVCEAGAEDNSVGWLITVTYTVKKKACNAHQIWCAPFVPSGTPYMA